VGDLVAQWILVILCAVALYHLVFVVIFVIALARPNPVGGLLRRLDGPEVYGLEPEVLRLTDGTPAWYFHHANARRTVLVCHGRSRSRRWMLPLVARLAERYHVLVFDFPAHGESPLRHSTLGLHESRVVEEALGELERRGARDIVVYGVSMGGVAAVFALARSASDSVVGLVTDGSFDRLTSVVARITRWVIAPTYLVRVADRCLVRVAGFSIDDVSPVEVVGRVKVPCRFLHGDSDRLVPVASSEAFARAYGDANAALVYPGGHDAPRNAEMQRALLQFVDGLE